MKWFTIIVIALISSIAVQAQQKALRKEIVSSIWQKCYPEEQGLSSVELNEMFDYIKTNKIRVHSIQILRHNKLLLDAYFYPYNAASLHEVASVTKSITSTLAGIAIDKRFIPGVSEAAFKYFPGYNSMDAIKQSVTIENLITMQSGLDCGTDLSDPAINVDQRLAQIRECPDWIACALQIPMATKPGEKFAYCNANCHLLSAIVEKATGKSLADFGARELFTPLGITNFYWPADPQGVNYGWADMQLHPYDMLKIGQLMLHKGKWGGKQLVSENWLNTATIAHVKETGGPDGYGYYWWVPGGDYPDVFEAVGRGGQRITVWPSKDMVIVFTGGGFNTSDLVPFIVKAIKGDNQPDKNQSAYLTLKRNIVKAATPPIALKVMPKPAIASSIEGKRYSLNANSLGFSSIRVTTVNEKEYRVEIIWNGQNVVCKAGLDGVPRFSMNPLVLLEQACTARWINDKSLEIQLDMVAAINNYTLTCGFEAGTSGITIIAKEGTGLNNEIIKGKL
jgi:CubicO group peptidase (beta-lactamase class C family)